LAIPASCDRGNVGAPPERNLVGKFADALCELDSDSIAERMIASGTALAPRVAPLGFDHLVPLLAQLVGLGFLGVA
jgi:hypothetical protein